METQTEYILNILQTKGPEFVRTKLIKFSKPFNNLTRGEYYLAIHKTNNKMYLGKYLSTKRDITFESGTGFEIYIENSILIKGPRVSNLRGTGSIYMFYPVDINEVNRIMGILDDDLNMDISLALHKQNMPNDLSREIYSYLGPNVDPYEVTEHKSPDNSNPYYNFKRQNKGGRKSRRKTKKTIKRKRGKTNKHK